MEIPDQPLSDLQAASDGLSRALGRYRLSGDSVDDTEVEEYPEVGLDAAANRYEQASLEVAGIIIGQLAAAGDQDTPRLDDDATTKLAASIAIDAKVAEQAALLLEIQEQRILASQPPRRLAGAEIDDLGEDLATAAQELIAELGQRGNGPLTPESPGPAGNPGPGPAGRTIEPYVLNILDLAGGDFLDTLSALVSWERRVCDLITEIGGTAAAWFTAALPQLAERWSALRKLLARAWRLVLAKVSVLAGQHAHELLAVLGDNPFTLMRHMKDRAAGAVLGEVLNTSKVIRIADSYLSNASDNAANTALRECRRVVDHHERRRKAVPWLNRALPACVLVHLSGFPLKTVAGVTLLIYSVWLAHDHLDSPVLENLRMPKNPGLLKVVEAAVGGP